MASRILLITPKFYGLENRIKLALEEFGFEVVWIENRILPFDYHGAKSKFKFLRRIYFMLFIPQIKYISKELNRIKNSRFDILFSINCFVICPYLFKKLKIKNTGLHSVLYLWDSFTMFNWTNEIKLFNKAFTFDPVDSEKYGIEYKPNFYIRNTGELNQGEENDLFFIGKFTPFRLKIVDKILNKSENKSINYFVRLWPAYKIFQHNRLLYSILKKSGIKSNWTNNYLINYEAVEGLLKREFIIPYKLGYEDMHYHFQNSNVILDLPYKYQRGYTHRIIDALACGKKVITSNSNILTERFFNPEQIHIIDEQNPVFDGNWVKEKSIFPVDKYFSDLELSLWLKSIINVGIA